MRRCFIHVGTHKTGTTSLQRVLSAHRDKLDGFSYCYPRAGRPAMAPDGHHNIAWQISKDYRFSKEAGAIDDVLAEIANWPLDVILSSEDFECSARHAEQFALFIERLKRQEFAVTFIVYLRNQIDFAASVYLAMVNWGCDRPFDRCIDEIVERGTFGWRDWIFNFDYDEFLSCLRDAGDVQLVVRSYDALRKGALVGDFLSIFGLKPGDLAVDENVWLNERRPTSAAAERFYQNCRHPPSAAKRAALASLLPPNGAPVGMSSRSKLRLIDRFKTSNRRVVDAYGIPEFAAMRPERINSEPSIDMSMEKIFSSGLGDAVDAIVRPMNSREPDPNA